LGEGWTPSLIVGRAKRLATLNQRASGVKRPGSTLFFLPTKDVTGARVGERLRVLRRERGLTIAQVAAATSLTSGFISQLERGLSSVSLSSLARICAALDIRFGDVLDVEPASPVIRRDEAGAWTVIGAHRDLLLSSLQDRRFHVIESHIPPGAGAGEDVYTFPADVELAYVLQGTLELRVGARVFVVGAGDTVTYSPRDPHTWRNPSSTDEAVVLWFSVPNPFWPGASAGGTEIEA
jgi:transcriptional regulator with XRE-family HTH domain